MTAYQRLAGFTLIEVMLAMLITAFVAMLAYSGLSTSIVAAEGHEEQAQQIADDVLRRAYTRLLSATERYELAWASWEDWQDTGQVSIDRRTGQLKQLWESGEISTTDYLVQLQQTLDVQESALDLREALWRAWFEWLVASGQIDNWPGQDAST